MRDAELEDLTYFVALYWSTDRCFPSSLLKNLYTHHVGLSMGMAFMAPLVPETAAILLYNFYKYKLVNSNELRDIQRELSSYAFRV